MAKRLSGNMTVNILWSDREDQWKASVCVRERGQKKPDCRRVNVGRTPADRLAVDCPEAYDQAAIAAISFAQNDAEQEGDRSWGEPDYDAALTGILISRSEKHRSKQYAEQIRIQAEMERGGR